MICVSPLELSLIQSILKKHAHDCEARVFGSRYKWTANNYSDLDIALAGEKKLTLKKLCAVKDAFEESTLPFRVDVLDWNAVSAEFREIISNGYEVIYAPKKQKAAWPTVRLGDVMLFGNGKKRPSETGRYPVYGGNGIFDYANEYNYENVIIIGRVGAYCGSVFLEPYKLWVSDNAIVVKNSENSDIRYDYYLLKQLQLNNRHIGTSQPLLTQEILSGIEVRMPPLPIQRSIAATLSCLDDKIELNNRINANLEAQAQAIFKSWFVDFEPFQGGEFVDSELGKIPKGWRVGALDTFFDIAIGKTPPRNEAQWFTKNTDDVKWVSIADMGRAGIYINDTSEYLTDEAIERFNINIIPRNTVILSFKLTVGRVAITECEMTSNEAIAHFKSPKKCLSEYLYLYLQNLNFSTLGSTSSIGIAINSKMVKSILMLMPDNKTMLQFYLTVEKMFNQIQINLHQSRILANIRDALLPRLMSGEIKTKEENL
jgi:type I restriction enzyme S subunit